MRRAATSAFPKVMLALGSLALCGPATADSWTKTEVWYGFDGNDGPTAMTSYDGGRNWYGVDFQHRVLHYVRKCDWWSCKAMTPGPFDPRDLACHSDSPFSAMECD